MKNTLSTNEARKLILQAQRLPNPKQTASAIDETLFAIEHLGYIQIDTISVIQRAHHHTLWNRNPRYETSHLDKLVEDKKVFEYWSHAAAYMPMSEYRYTLPRKQALLTNAQKHWFDKDEKLMNHVIERISKEGPLMAKDFEHSGKKSKDWTSKPAKKALECLFMQGDLMISSRSNFHKVYDLTSNVIPENIDTSIPSEQEYIRFLITKYLEVNALGQASQMAYLLKNTKRQINSNLKEMLSNKELVQIQVKDEIYYALPHLLENEVKTTNSKRVKILSPFDNLLIQRKRMQELFDFDYLIECYVPQEKRKYGYFSLPILWDGKLVARMDCKADRKESILHIKNLVLEDSLSKTEAFASALYKEFLLFLKFNKCKDFIVHKTSPSSFKSLFLESIKK